MAPFELPATLSVDTIFEWRSTIAKVECCCRLRLYKFSFNHAVVIVSEIPENSGRSITDEAATLIHLVCYRYGISTHKLRWFEHYPLGYLKDEDSYEELMLTMGDISSKRISRQKLQEFLGVSF